METIALEGLLEEINRQCDTIDDNSTSALPTISKKLPLDDSIQELSYKDEEYRLMIFRVKERLCEIIKSSPSKQCTEIARIVEPSLWKVLLFSKSRQYFIEPECMKQSCQAMQSLRRNRRGNNSSSFCLGEAIWKDAKLAEWALKDESSFIILQGSFGTLEYVEKTAVELIEYLQTHDQKVAWILKAFPYGTTQQSPPQKWDSQSTLKQLVIQIMRYKDPLNTLRTLAFVVESFKQKSLEIFNSLVYALEGMSILYIVIDMGIFGSDSAEMIFWSAGFKEVFDKLGAKSSFTRLKVILLNCHPLPDTLPTNLVIKFPVPAQTSLRHPSRQISGLPWKSKIQLNLLKRPAENTELELASNQNLERLAEKQQPSPASSQVQPLVDQNIANSSVATTKRQKRDKIRRSRDWFDEMKNFETCVDASRKDPDESSPRVKIAILDTGVDISHPKILREYQNGRMKYHNFLDESNEIEDLDGHGTHCASLVAKFAPNCEIYVGRVFRRSVAEEGSAKIAVEHATTIWNVDIISLSLGFTEDDEDLRDEIRKACARSIIVFAAAANNTTNEIIPIRFPARMKEVICIFSSDAYGRPSEFNPPTRYDRANFTFPGEKIEGAWPSYIPAKDTFERKGVTYKLQDGTSCSTPIASAVASGILEFAWQEREHKIRRVKQLKHYSGMADVFLKRMVDQHKSGENMYHYVKPWKLISITKVKDEIPIFISDTLDHMDY